jgi:hypothetical protein
MPESGVDRFRSLRANGASNTGLIDVPFVPTTEHDLLWK